MTSVPSTLPAPSARREVSTLGRAVKHVRRNRLALAATVFLGVMYLLAAFADFVAPYGESEAYYRGAIVRTYAPPAQLHWRDPRTGAVTRPFVYPLTQERDPSTFELVYKEDTAQPYPVQFFVRGTPYVPFPLSLIPEGWRQASGFQPQVSWHLFGVAKPALVQLWGADQLGRDVFGRILFGARITLTVGIFASFLTLLIGVVVGGISGFYGGIVDDVCMRLVEILITIPSLFLLLALRAVFPLDAKSSTVFFIMILILGLIRWGTIARVVRGQVLSLREEEYVQAARGLGARDGRIIFRHVLPGTISYAIVSLSLLIPSFILTEAGLSFLGLGISEPNSSWGLMLASAQEGGIQTFVSRTWLLVPGLFIFLAVLAFNFLGDGLRDAFDPKARK